MSNYTFVNYKGCGLLRPKNSWKTREYLAENEKLYMTEHLLENRHKQYRRYRVRSREPIRFTDTLEYDIECPHCHDKLRLCDVPIDSTTHGLYKCRRCDEETDKLERY